MTIAIIELPRQQHDFFSLGAYFDIYDNHGALLGKVKEHIFTFLPRFSLYSSSSVKLAFAQMNFWGTTFTVYDAQNEHVIAVMSRPYFRMKNDWKIEIKNQNLLNEKNINSSLLLTVLALQGDLEQWKKQNNKILQTTRATPDDWVTETKNKISTASGNQNLSDVKLLAPEGLSELAQTLDENYQAHTINTINNADVKQQVVDFVDYCLELAQSDQVSPEEKKAIFYLLEKRLTSME